MYLAATVYVGITALTMITFSTHCDNGKDDQIKLIQTLDKVLTERFVVLLSPDGTHE